MIAFGIDFLACYFIAVLTTLIPFVNRLLSLELTMALLFLTKDFFFQGRGLGKNLMGFKVIDAGTGQPITLTQSMIRNVVFIAPFLAVQLVSILVRFIPIPWVDAAVMNLVHIVCALYIAIVLPLESLRVLNHPDGLRKGDELARTRLIEAPMDFNHLLSFTKD